MFFGAGNVIFPLVIGQAAGDQTLYAILGLLLTAVGVPFMGLVGIILFKGNYQHFFARLGKTPGLLLTILIMFLIGPFGAIPRCIALSYSTLKTSLPSLSLGLFSLIACFVIFAFTVKKNRTVELLGNILTPFLLISLFIIVVAGLSAPSDWQASLSTPLQSFKHGLIEGYNTMDLLASFFFSSIIFHGLKSQCQASNPASSNRLLFYTTLKASCIGALLLSLVYIGFSFVAAYHMTTLDVEQDELLGALTLKILGPHAGIVAALTIALACLTTAIALAVVFAEFLQKVLCQDRINYVSALTLTLIVSYFISTLEFKGIVALLAPLLQVIYPLLIILTLVNIIYSLFSEKGIELEVKS